MKCKYCGWVFNAVDLVFDFTNNRTRNLCPRCGEVIQ